MRGYWQRSIVAGFVVLGIATLTQPVFADNLIEVYRKALENDPQFLGASHTHSAAGETVKEARGRMLPQLGLEYSRSNTDQKIKNSDNPLYRPGETDFFTTDYSLTLTQPLFDWSLYVGYQQAKMEAQRADAEFSSKRQDMMLRTAERYLVALAAGDQIGFARSEKAAVQKQLELVEVQMSAGIARKTELYDAQARYALIEAEEIGALSNYDDKLQALREIVGELSGDLATLTSNLKLIPPEPLDPEVWMQAAMEQNPRVLLQARMVEVSRREVELQKAAHLPTLNLTARVNNRDTGGTLFGGGNEVKTSDVQIRFNMPLYQGGIVSARSRKSHQLYQKARQDLTEAQRAVQRSARESYFGVISSISKVNAVGKSVSSKELALNLKQQGYRSGLYTSLDVLDTERDVYEAKRDHSHARYEYLLNSLRLKHAVGTLAEADIVGINAWLRD